MATSTAVVPGRESLTKMLQEIGSTEGGRPRLPVETEIDGPRRTGMVIAFLVFGVFGVWATFAPIEGAAHAMGTITVKSFNQQVQHLEGGIVKDILVQDGDMVNAGDTLLIIDNTQPLAQLGIANTELVSLSALEARLIAERDNQESVTYPEFLRNSGPDAQAEIAGQNQVFTARKNAREGEIAVLEQRIEQLQSQLVGMRALHESKTTLASSFGEELKDIQSLLDEGFADKVRLRELERNHALNQGEAAQLLSQIASTEMQVGETRLQILQTNLQFQTDVADALAQTQTKLKDTRERIIALSDIVTRTDVRAPVSGYVNGLQVHTIGGVVPAGSPIAEIVPEADELVVTARVNPIDIDRVAIGQEATIRFPTFSSKSVPTLEGSVINISADAFEDEATGSQYYQARVELTPESVADLDELELVPGMPAEVFINSGARTFLQYIMKPFSNVLARSFRED